MEIIRKYFPDILLENDKVYFAQLEGILSSVDELCCLQITKTASAYIFRVAPSIPLYNKLLLQEILKFHNLFHIKLDISKSIKTTGSIVFKITL